MNITVNHSQIIEVHHNLKSSMVLTFTKYSVHCTVYTMPTVSSEGVGAGSQVQPKNYSEGSPYQISPCVLKSQVHIVDIVDHHPIESEKVEKQFNKWMWRSTEGLLLVKSNQLSFILLHHHHHHHHHHHQQHQQNHLSCWLSFKLFSHHLHNISKNHQHLSSDAQIYFWLKHPKVVISMLWSSPLLSWQTGSLNLY